MRLVLPFIALIALVACEQTPEQTPQVGASPAAPVVEASPAPVAPGPSGPQAVAAPEVTLMANGIIMVGAIDGRGTATTLEFGRDRANVLAVMEIDFGKPKLGKLAECGAGPMEFAAWGPLTLNFMDDKFVGWRAEKGAQVVTVDGLQFGNTLTEIRHERSAQRIADTTLDGEFEYASGDGGTIGGFLQGTGDAAKVISFHAGTTCFFR